MMDFLLRTSCPWPGIPRAWELRSAAFRAPAACTRPQLPVQESESSKSLSHRCRAIHMYTTGRRRWVQPFPFPSEVLATFHRPSTPAGGGKGGARSADFCFLSLPSARERRSKSQHSHVRTLLQRCVVHPSCFMHGTRHTHTLRWGASGDERCHLPPANMGLRVTCRLRDRHGDGAMQGYRACCWPGKAGISGPV